MAFKDIINQHKAKEILSGQMKSGRIPHAYIFLGQPGVGRRLTALELSKALNCEKNTNPLSINEPCDQCISCVKIDKKNHPDVQCIDFAYQANLEGKEIEKQKTIKIDTIRAMQKDINLKPVEGRWKIFIIEPAEKMNIDAANCLLKTLEEPPAWTMIILLAKHKENLPATIASRAQIIFFNPLNDNEIISILKTKYALSQEHAALIAAKAEGSLANAVPLIEQITENTNFAWGKIKNNNLSSKELLGISQQYYKDAPAFLNELLNDAKNDFRANPDKSAAVIEEILASQKYLERNVNAQMVLDVLLLKINKYISIN